MAHKTVLIGSAAIEERSPGLLRRTPNDLDYMSILPVAEAPNGDLISGSGIMDTYEFHEPVATLSEVYTLKVSHSPWVIGSNRNWYKHLRDISLLKSEGAVLIPELHDLAYRQWEIRKGAKRVDLNQDSSEFFGEGVRRNYEHDSLHRALAYNPGHPLFEKILPEGSTVLPSRKLFEALLPTEKELLVREEAMVLALERELIPRSREVEPDETLIRTAYDEWLQALVVRLSKGWFPRWIIENYSVVRQVDLNYWSKFRSSPYPVRIA